MVVFGCHILFTGERFNGLYIGDGSLFITPSDIDARSQQYTHESRGESGKKVDEMRLLSDNTSKASS